MKDLIVMMLLGPVFFSCSLLNQAESWGASDDRVRERQAMIATQIEARGIKDPRVLEAMQRVPRHLFVSEEMRRYAYEDNPLPIGHRQTISQPYIVALMTELARISPGDRVLEIGTGSGYQSAVLSEMGAEVYTIEIIQGLAKESEQRLHDLGYKNIHVKWADGYKGWPEQAPFHAIIVTAAPPEVPQELLRQLAIGGRMVLPVGDFIQDLFVITKNKDGTFTEERNIPVRFVPMVHHK